MNTSDAPRTVELMENVVTWRALFVLDEIVARGSARFRDLQACTPMSDPSLVRALDNLTEAGYVSKRAPTTGSFQHYVPTHRAAELVPVLHACMRAAGERSYD